MSKEEVNMSIIGALDAIDKGKITGWIADLDDFNKSISFDLIINHDHVGTYHADLFRYDLLESNIGTGHYGFSVDLPAPYAKKRNLDVRIRPLHFFVETDFTKQFLGAGRGDYSVAERRVTAKK